MLEVKRFVNELMSSNCYIVWDNSSKECIVIDPGSKDSIREIDFIESQGLDLKYIIITHEHTDHNWGCVSLKKRFPNAQIVCHKECSNMINHESSTYFRLYYDDPNYSYSIDKVDKVFDSEEFCFDFTNHTIRLLYTPGHSMGSICILIDNLMFSGDTIMLFKPYINKRNGSKKLYKQTIKKLIVKYRDKDIVIFPGHGDAFNFEHYINNNEIITSH